jgi:hypothetical protein
LHGGPPLIQFPCHYRVLISQKSKYQFEMKSPRQVPHTDAWNIEVSNWCRPVGSLAWKWVVFQDVALVIIDD